MKNYLYILITIMLVVIEAAFYMSHPIQLVLPTQYFPEEESQFFNLMIITLLGVGYPMLSLMSGMLDLKHRLVMLCIGIIDSIVLNHHSLLLMVSIGILLGYFINNQIIKDVIGLSLLLIGGILAAPIIILTYYSESYVDIGLMQKMIALYRSNDFAAYIYDHMSQFNSDSVLIGIFVLLPLTFIAPTIQQMMVHNKYSRWLIGSVLLFAGIFIKTLAISTTSITAFQLIVITGGTLTAIALFILINPLGVDILHSSMIIMFADILLLWIFTGIGLKQYKTLAADEVALYAAIIAAAFSIVYFLIVYIKSLRSKA